MLEQLKNKVTMVILKTIVSKYFNDLKVKGYKLEINDEKNSYKIVALLPKDCINNLVSKFKK